jgi:hypothetical protein
MVTFVRYRQPDQVGVPLGIPPRLESWDSKTSPSQIALGRYLDHVETLTRPRMLALSDAPLALRLFVGFDASVDVLSRGRDLDNYLFPIVRRLGASRFVSVWAAKGVAESVIEIERAVPAPVSSDDRWRFASAVTNASSQTAAWKDQVSQQIAAQTQEVVCEGGVELEICFRVSPKRNWSTLWKPAIDSLECVLGQDNPARPYHPRDDRIIQLGLHRMDDSGVGHDVHIGIWWRPATPRTRTPEAPTRTPRAM